MSAPAPSPMAQKINSMPHKDLKILAIKQLTLMKNLKTKCDQLEKSVDRKVSHESDKNDSLAQENEQLKESLEKLEKEKRDYENEIEELDKENSSLNSQNSELQIDNNKLRNLWRDFI